MGRPRKTAPTDLFADLSKKTEILEREMNAQREAIERLRDIGKRTAQPLRASLPSAHTLKRRATR